MMRNSETATCPSRPLSLAMLALAGVLALPLTAQEVSRVSADEALVAPATSVRAQPDVVRSFGDKATFTIQYDDGEADNGYGPANTATYYDNVMLFNLPQAGLNVDAFEVCFSRLGADNVLDFEINFWRANGAGGAPGTLIDSVSAQATGVTTDLEGTYYIYDLSSFGIALPNNTAYVGVGWDPTVDQDFFVCSDWDRASVQPAYSQINQDGLWNTPPAGDANYTAMMYRLTASDDGGGTGECIPSAAVLCLNDGRFRVETIWRTPSGATGQGKAVPLTDDTGYFWFFNADNVEMVVKVLNGCPLNNRYWVFAGGLTNVEVTMTVTDTETGTVAPPYRNPLRTPFQPIQDTQAFATCP